MNGHLDTHLVVEEALLHAVVGADLLQNVPGKLAVQLIGDEAHGDGDDANDGGNRNEERPTQLPDVLVLPVRLERAGPQKAVDRVVDLVDLQDRVDEQCQVGHAQADDLNCVLEPQGVP